MLSRWLKKANTFETCAYFCREFQCEACGAIASLTSLRPRGSIEWCSEVAPQVQRMGWVMPPKPIRDERTLQWTSLHCYCPECTEECAKVRPTPFRFSDFGLRQSPGV